MKVQKILIITLFLALIAPEICAQKWVASPGSAGLLPNNYTVWGIKVVDKDVVWATADAKPNNAPATNPTLIKVLRTTNGGQTWRVTNVPAALGLYTLDIIAFDSTTAWITTSSKASVGGLFKTTDGGQTWVKKLADNAGDSYVRFFDRNNGVCLGYGNRFAYTSDGGDNWTIDSTSLPLIGAEKPAVFFSGTNNFITKGDTVWFGTTAGRIMRSTNKGRNWTPHSTGILPNWGIATLAFQDARNGMLVGIDTSTYKYKGMAKTNDGGITWQSVAQSAISSSFSWFASLTTIPNKDKNAYLLGLENQSSSIAKSVFTIDNGSGWFGIDPDIHSHGASAFISPQIGWIGNGFVNNALNSAAMFKWDDLGIFTPTIEIKNNTFFNIYPNPTNDVLNLQFDNSANSDTFDAQITDVAGRVVVKTNTTNKQLIVSQLPMGIYFLTVRTNDKIGVVKFIKN